MAKPFYLKNHYLISIMDLIENLPEDVRLIILRILSKISKISIVVLSHVNTFCYRIARKCAIENRISKALQCHDIASEGSLEVLKWARESGYQWDFRTCNFAALNGHLHILMWAKLNDYPWDSATIAWAALGGHLEILKWARSNNCEWNYLTCYFAAKKGHYHILKWAISEGCDMDYDTEMLIKSKWPELLKN
jgi:hypothetical protein